MFLGAVSSSSFAFAAASKFFPARFNSVRQQFGGACKVTPNSTTTTTNKLHSFATQHAFRGCYRATELLRRHKNKPCYWLTRTRLLHQQQQPEQTNSAVSFTVPRLAACSSVPAWPSPARAPAWSSLKSAPALPTRASRFSAAHVAHSPPVSSNQPSTRG
jgi:hypothetical protein